MHPGATICHECRPHFRLGENRSKPVASQAMNCIEHMLDIGAAYTEQTVNSPITKRDYERVCEFHVRGSYLLDGVSFRLSNFARP